MSPRLYAYVGPPGIKASVRREAHCRSLDSLADLEAWLGENSPRDRSTGAVPATYVVDAAGRLWIADRRSEHVACADGGEVLAAGELVFGISRDAIRVIEASNQSTGYCPDPCCWNALGAELERLGLPGPPDFTAAFTFRRCPACGAINVVKDGYFECDVCGAELPAEWNFG